MGVIHFNLRKTATIPEIEVENEFTVRMKKNNIPRLEKKY